MYSNIVVIGASGSIGSAMLKNLAHNYPNATIHGFSQKEIESKIDNISYKKINYSDEESISLSANIASSDSPLDLVIITTGFLHDDTTKPEKSLMNISTDKFNKLFLANTITPALLAKYFVPKLNKNNKSIFAALSARVGSISDNRLGGWYAYRASKAALNMIIKNISIENKIKNKNSIIVGLHPGTVDSELSKPYQHNVPEGKLFTSNYSSEQLLKVIDNLTINDTGKCFAWDGNEIYP